MGLEEVDGGRADRCACGRGGQRWACRQLPLDSGAHGNPIHQRGITEHPGLYFLGLSWLHKAKSGLLYGVGEDAAHTVDHLTANLGRPPA